MAVRKRTWINKNGTQTSAWVADFSDGNGRHMRTFESKSDAVAFFAGLPKRPRRIMAAPLLAEMTTDQKLDLLIDKLDLLIKYLAEWEQERDRERSMPPPQPLPPPAFDDPSDIQWGLQALADTLRVDVSKVYYMIHAKKHRIPVRHHGGHTYSFSRRRVLAWCGGD